ncbi:GGDEF domain-containing protein [Cellvibrio japonicus]|nr:GGDEF domain-containing protein [Cellvibrio japonicus]QEI13691.1 GGDEF domain-containing protein [Cellvibrio japonicus]QEI17265.1 GGDEF domain-containing protein [Cellvibrio japonicus]QEI20842.1 GGDEF domain-containing protein [Cellvibrio japonicus]
MNARRFNSVLLLAMVFTLVAIFAQEFLPTKRLLLTPSPQGIYYLYSTELADGSPAGSWISEHERKMRCVFPGNITNVHYSCSLNQLFATGPTRGIDLSGYTHMRIHVAHNGKTPRRIRVSLRNFAPAYSRETDTNSSKYHAVILRSEEINRMTSIPIHDFTVSDWWIDQYQIPRSQAQLELSNVMNLGLDFFDSLTPGDDELELRHLEFTGEWISKETWYLLILGCWMAGITLYATSRLIQLNRQTKHDTQVINSLHLDKQKLQLETDKFRRLSTVDPLTQAYNRFGIDQIVTTLMNHSELQTTEAADFALMVMDIDHFKQINDNYGHDLGDKILQRIAHIIQENLHAEDFLGRWGGEEFIVIQPNTSKEFAMALADKIRQVIATTYFESGNTVRVTLSVGVGERLIGEDFAATFKRVDEALYRAKAEGRNRCIMV